MVARYLMIAVIVVVAAVFAPDLLRDYFKDAPVAAVARQEAHEPVPPSGLRTLVLKAGRGGHYEVSAHINGRPVRSLIDTGATTLALPLDVAEKSGIRPAKSAFVVKVRTANGVALAAPVTLRELRLGSIRLDNVEALVMPKGTLELPLIGMSVLGRLATVDIRSGTMRLIQ